MSIIFDYQRFFNKIKIEDGHWLWQGALDKDGYGRCKQGARTHRWSYEYFIGKIPEGFHIDHLCKIRNCANPFHLEPVTPRENVYRSHPIHKTHCPKGHEYTQENSWINPKKQGDKRCRACSRLNNAVQYQRRKVINECKSFI